MVGDFVRDKDAITSALLACGTTYAKAREVLSTTSCYSCTQTQFLQRALDSMRKRNGRSRTNQTNDGGLTRTPYTEIDGEK